MDIAGHSMHGMDQAAKRRSQEASARRSAMRHSGSKMNMGVDTGGMAAEHGEVRGPLGAFPPGSAALMHGPDTHGVGNSAVPMELSSRLNDPGSGFEAADGRVLTYADLVSLTAQPDGREPSRTVELHITGNMERYMWSFDGKTFLDARTPILQRGERVRLIFANDTMMEHPIHLHGMWMELENGAGAHQPRKHTISVKPAERLSLAITPGESGGWAMHCHLLLHMDMGIVPGR